MAERDDIWELRNKATGEVGIFDPGMARPVRLGRAHPYHQRGRFAWYTVSADEYASAVRTLRGSALHVFAALPLLMGKDNVLLIKQTAIREATGLSSTAVSDGMKAMRRQLLVGDLQGVPRFSPEIAWKGYLEDLAFTRKLWREAKAEWVAERRRSLAHG